MSSAVIKVFDYFDSLMYVLYINQPQPLEMHRNWFINLNVVKSVTTVEVKELAF